MCTGGAGVHGAIGHGKVGTLWVRNKGHEVSPL